MFNMLQILQFLLLPALLIVVSDTDNGDEVIRQSTCRPLSVFGEKKNKLLPVNKQNN